MVVVGRLIRTPINVVLVGVPRDVNAFAYRRVQGLSLNHRTLPDPPGDLEPSPNMFYLIIILRCGNIHQHTRQSAYSVQLQSHAYSPIYAIHMSVDEKHRRGQTISEHDDATYIYIFEKERETRHAHLMALYTCTRPSIPIITYKLHIIYTISQFLQLGPRFCVTPLARIKNEYVCSIDHACVCTLMFALCAHRVARSQNTKKRT